MANYSVDAAAHQAAMCGEDLYGAAPATPATPAGPWPRPLIFGFTYTREAEAQLDEADR